MAKFLRALVCQWFDEIEVDNPKVAQFLCKVIPASCPFEREIKLFDHTLFHISPLCKLNPLYEQMVGLRFKALSYLAATNSPATSSREITMTDNCSGDVALYC
ncbi:MAG: Mo-dependent nitrogenase C-terminal domain-containing protein [Chroococcidiopsidaceae cyanobacterium CP_BM_RX_35]|nr:Mo-dependent nitrogenase C-terminal domain-containing protein [Chroococcidiopsidaceae cyanobacterium CP_BM_RX_35]